MNTTQINRLLSNHAFFAHLSADSLQKLVNTIEVIRFNVGAKLYTQNAPADSAFLILNGSVNLIDERNGKQDLVQFIGVGAVISHLALVTQTLRLTSAYAHTSLEVGQIHRSDFINILRQEPDAAIALRAYLLSILDISKQERETLILELERGI